MIEKSAPYACPELSGGVGIYILAEVALGNCNELYQIDRDADKLPKGKDSIFAIGFRQPDSKDVKKIFGDVIVPYGPLVPNPKGTRSANEFIVYKTNQIKMRYIVRIKNSGY